MGLAVWDTVYFARVARCGYETDKINAFFPLLPAAMHGLSHATGVPEFEVLQLVASQPAVDYFWC
jgi:hypothetical protein